MTTIVKPFPPFERFVKQFLLSSLPELAALDPAAADALVGGDLAYDATTQPFYIRIDRLGGTTDRFGGTLPFDLEVFGPSYGEAESRANDIEALLLGYPHVVEVEGQKMIFDDVSQNVGVFELPWEDDNTFRLGATYVITARRR